MRLSPGVVKSPVVAGTVGNGRATACVATTAHGLHIQWLRVITMVVFGGPPPAIRAGLGFWSLQSTVFDGAGNKLMGFVLSSACVVIATATDTAKSRRSTIHQAGGAALCAFEFFEHSSALHCRGCGNLWCPIFANQLGPDQVPVIGAQIPAHDSPVGCLLDSDTGLNGYGPNALYPLVHRGRRDLEQGGQNCLRAKLLTGLLNGGFLNGHGPTIRHCLTVVNRHCLCMCPTG